VDGKEGFDMISFLTYNEIENGLGVGDTSSNSLTDTYAFFSNNMIKSRQRRNSLPFCV
jgi:hypothetical protein